VNGQPISDETWAGIRAEFTLPALQQGRRRLSELMEDPEPGPSEPILAVHDQGALRTEEEQQLLKLRASGVLARSSIVRTVGASPVSRPIISPYSHIPRPFSRRSFVGHGNDARPASLSQLPKPQGTMILGNGARSVIRYWQSAGTPLSSLPQRTPSGWRT
jgi:hypothetical protein